MKGLLAKVAGAARSGADLKVRVSLDTDGGPAGPHVVRCDVYDPRGRWCSHYSKNLVTEAGSGELRIPLAESDPAGAWRLELRDCVTGQRAKSKFRVATR